VGDGAWGRHREDIIHGAGSGGTHGMRGERVGVGDIGEVPGGAGHAGVKAGSGDCWGAIVLQDTGLVDGRAGLERHARYELTSNRTGIGDGVWGRYGEDGIHMSGLGGAHGMRRNRVVI